MIAELKDKILNLSNDISLLISECPNLNSLEEIRINATTVANDELGSAKDYALVVVKL